MRPSLLDPLFARLISAPGIGPKQEELFARLLAREDRPLRVIDLLFHMPSGALDRRDQPKLRDVSPGSLVTVRVVIDRHVPPPLLRARAPYRIYAHDETGDLILAYFKAQKPYLERLFPVGSVRWVSGTAAMWDGTLQMVHPDRVADEESAGTVARVEPLYPLTEGLTAHKVRSAVAEALRKLPELPEWQTAGLLPLREPLSFAGALRTLHLPQEPEDLSLTGPAWSRLAGDELLANQLALAIVRADMRRPAGERHAGSGALRETIIAALPYALTTSQQSALQEIAADLAGPQRMLRLLQGDVGSGKTVVALLAAAGVIEADGQAALMAPTEILARQHYRTIEPLARQAGVRVAIVTGRERGTERKEILQQLVSGEIDLIVGTHVLFQDEVVFKRLALAIVDEQHRFGVHQRLALTAKGPAVDVLVLTATPIPRTLVLAYFGDMDVSQLREKPAGRQPIDTRTIPLSRLDEVIEGVERAINAGHRGYWVCPLVEESENSDLAAAEDRFESLRDRFGARVGLVHGRMRNADKDEVMARFATGEVPLLVATTVVEVGVDVPEATLMVIEHAERFGLAQLHQLRGRIGRGTEQSRCILLYRAPLADVAKARLAIMRETDDGFRIAEEDLRLRGEGDVLGTRQSGMPGFRIARMDAHGHLVEGARADAINILRSDPRLTSERGRALRTLLYLFERDEAIRLLRAG